MFVIGKTMIIFRKISQYVTIVNNYNMVFTDQFFYQAGSGQSYPQLQLSHYTI